MKQLNLVSIYLTFSTDNREERGKIYKQILPTDKLNMLEWSFEKVFYA